ncbi:MAG: hypothetical protein FWE62_04800 [Firmicutes bacterium]|nr:hypothetical protein [Bacillota bacterium]
MTTEKINEIRTRCNAATPGPWDSIIGSADFATIYPYGEVNYPIATLYRGDEYFLLDEEYGVLRKVGLQYLQNNAANDAEFITHARQDIPALLAEINRLTRERDKYFNDLSSECIFCIHFTPDENCTQTCEFDADDNMTGWQWRGAHEQEPT